MCFSHALIGYLTSRDAALVYTKPENQWTSIGLLKNSNKLDTVIVLYLMGK